MVKKILLTNLIIVIIISTFATITPVCVVNANPMHLAWYPTEPDMTPPIIAIHSPIHNHIYNLTTVSLNFSVTKPESWFSNYQYGPSSQYMAVVRVLLYHTILDENEIQNTTVEDWFYLTKKREETKTFSANLTVTEGLHDLQLVFDIESVYVSDGEMHRFADGSKSVVFSAESEKIEFSVDTTPPNVSILDVKNPREDPTSVQLNYTVNDPNAEIFYSVDGKENVTINGNTTITELSEGSHNLIVYAEDLVGNIGRSKIAYFSAYSKAEEITAWSYVSTENILIVVFIAMLTVAVIVYVRKKRVYQKPANKF